MGADFYVIWNEKTELYYDGHGCSIKELRDTLSRFVSIKNATNDIKERRRRGADVSDWRIVPINMIIDGSPIKPDLGVTKSGYVIKFVNPGPYGRTCYWRGNKKKPVLEFSAIHYGPESPATASTFESKAIAQMMLDDFKVQLQKLIDAESASMAREADQGSKVHSGIYDILTSVKLSLVKVGE